MQNNKPAYAVCSKCGKRWNVSILLQTPKDSYICPNCSNKRHKRVKTATKLLILMALSIILFKFAAKAAYIERGYIAYGGEYLLLLLPVYWKLIEITVRDSIQAFEKEKSARKKPC